MPQVPFVEGYMTNEDLRAALMNLTQLMMAQAHVDEDPQGFVDKVFKVVDATGVTPREKAELAAY
ncbi:hypothetical protein EJD97_008128 [Solanum chilense]|uniref:Uncharacterized protein n=1 Tax=Solanum chilense TaxID=4083 RepID=A0A6N2CLS1_SOLCI|nr:hypothetical protein EJD97_008128 [Solanum chilense]